MRDELHITKEIPGSDANLKVTYAYDNLNRLIGEYGYDANTAGATSVYERLYHYDGSGNADRIVYYDRGVHWTGWTCDYNDQNELTQRYANLIGFATGSEGEARWSYTYDANGNLTQKKQETLSGSWGESLKWDYTWDVRNQMTSASKYVSSSYAGKVEYRYSHAYRGQRTDRIEYDSSNNITSWKRYVNDGLLIYRVEERYDSDQDGIDSSDPWRLKEEKFYRPGQIGNLFYKDVYYYPSDTSSANSTSRTFHYGYDAVGNVILVNEEYCGGTSFTYAFMQDAFGNQLDIGVFSGDDWWDAAADDCVYEHQTGKEFDTFTGLYFFHHRWYDPVVGRFVSRTKYRSDNEGAYIYCENNPLANVDPSGWQAVTSFHIDVSCTNAFSIGSNGIVDLSRDIILGWLDLRETIEGTGVRNRLQQCPCSKTRDAGSGSSRTFRIPNCAETFKGCPKYDDCLGCLLNNPRTPIIVKCDLTGGRSGGRVGSNTIRLNPNTSGRSQFAATIIHEMAHICGAGADLPLTCALGLCSEQYIQTYTDQMSNRRCEAYWVQNVFGLYP